MSRAFNYHRSPGALCLQRSIIFWTVVYAEGMVLLLGFAVGIIAGWFSGPVERSAE